MAKLSLNQLIASFSGVKALAIQPPDERPVFLIVEDDNSTIVIKRETAVTGGDKLNLKFNLKVMKQFSTTATGKLMQQSEIAAIGSFLDQSAYYHKNVRGAGAESKDVAYLRRIYNEGPAAGNWFKMNKAEGITSLESARNALMNDGNKSGVRAMAALLNRHGGLEALGKIVAIDLFNGNQDRFLAPRTDNEVTKDTHKGRKDDFSGTKYRVLANIGNVIAAVEDGKIKPVGLDSYEAQAYLRDLNQSLDDVEQVETWTGRYLVASERDTRKQYAKDIVADLEDALGPRERKMVMARTQRLDADAARRVFKGMEEGIKDLFVYLQRLGNKPNLPVGMRDRIDALLT